MPPHGPGMTNATHSHDPEFPNDDWNLYSMLDPALTTALNATRPGDTVGIFRPFVRRLEPAPVLISDADEEMLVIARFTSPVHIRKLMVIGGGDGDGQHPSHVKCYVNQESLDFTSLESTRCAQELDLPINSNGTVELHLSPMHAFSNVTMLALYFTANHAEASHTVLKYIGLQGEHTHHRREAVDAQYEVLCSGQDIHQPEDAAGAHATLH